MRANSALSGRGGSQTAWGCGCPIPRNGSSMPRFQASSGGCDGHAHNAAPSCAAAARGAISAGRDKEACLVDERTAEGVLVQNWSKYDAADKTQCVGNVKTGGPASYVELLSCLEIMRDAKAIRQGDVLAPSDQPSGLMRPRR